MQKVWALRKPILDAHMLSLQKKIQVLEQKVDEIVIENRVGGFPKNNKYLQLKNNISVIVEKSMDFTAH